MDTRLFLTLNNIAHSLEQVTKSFDAQNERSRSETNDALRSVNTSKSIIALQESIVQNLVQNNRLMNTQQQMLGMMRNQLGAIKFPTLPLTQQPIEPTLATTTGVRTEPTILNQPKLNEIVVPVRYISSELPILKPKPYEIPVVYGDISTPKLPLNSKLSIPVEIGKLPDISSIKLPPTILPIEYGKIPEFKVDAIKPKIPVDFELPKIITQSIPLKYDLLPKITLPDLIQNIKYSKSPMVNLDQPKEMVIPVTYLPNEKKVSVTWDVEKFDPPIISPLNIQSKILVPTLPKLEEPVVTTIPLKYGTLPKFDSLQTIGEQLIPLKVSKIDLTNEIQNVRNQIKSENLELPIRVQRVEEVTNTNLTNTTNFIGEFVNKLNMLDQVELQNKFIGLSKSVDLVSESTRRLNTNLELEKISTLKNISTTPMIMSMIDNTQFNKLIDKFEQNSKLVQSVIENNSRNFGQTTTIQTTTEVSSPIIKMEQVKSENSSPKDMKDLYDVMSRVNSNLSIMIQSITSLSTSIEANRSETYLRGR